MIEEWYVVAGGIVYRTINKLYAGRRRAVEGTRNWETPGQSRLGFLVIAPETHTTGEKSKVEKIGMGHGRGSWG